MALAPHPSPSSLSAQVTPRKRSRGCVDWHFCPFSQVHLGYPLSISPSSLGPGPGLPWPSLPSMCGTLRQIIASLAVETAATLELITLSSGTNDVWSSPHTPDSYCELSAFRASCSILRLQGWEHSLLDHLWIAVQERGWFSLIVGGQPEHLSAGLQAQWELRLKPVLNTQRFRASHQPDSQAMLSVVLSAHHPKGIGASEKEPIQLILLFMMMWERETVSQGTHSFAKMKIKAPFFLCGLGMQTLLPSSVATSGEENKGFSLGWNSSEATSPEDISLYLSVDSGTPAPSDTGLRLTCLYVDWTKVTQTVQVLLPSFLLLHKKLPQI